MNCINIKVLSVLIIGVLVYACGSPSEEIQEELPDTMDQTSRYGVVDYDFPELSMAARNQIDEWTIFSDFEDEAKKINGTTLANLKVTTERLLTHTDSLASKFPDTLNTLAISTRLILVKTRGHVLAQELNRDRLDSVKIQNDIQELNEAVKNFIFRLNEEFRKNAIDMQLQENERKELEKQERFLDSVYKAELNDQNN